MFCVTIRAQQWKSNSVNRGYLIALCLTLAHFNLLWKSFICKCKVRDLVQHFISLYGSEILNALNIILSTCITKLSIVE